MHVAMVSIPAYGHVNPSLEVIRELVARGHRVTYANDPSFGRIVRDVGAELMAYDSTLTGAEWPADVVGTLEVFLDDAISMLPQLRAAYGNDKPDLFLYDIAGAPVRLLGWEWGIPAVQLSPAAVAWDGYEQDLPGAEGYQRRYAEWLAANGSRTTDSLEFLGRPDRCVALIPAAMQPHLDLVDRSVYDFAGPVIGPRDGAWQRPEGAENVLLISLGSEFTDHLGFYRRCIAAFGDLPGWHTVLQFGKHVRRADLGELPSTVEAYEWVPQTAVLEQADAFLTHAGMGGCAEGLWAGTPMLCWPQAADQFGNADRLVELGVAARLDKTDIADLRSALLDLVTDSRVRNESGRLAAEVRAASGAGRATDLCLQGMESGAAGPGGNC